MQSPLAKFLLASLVLVSSLFLSGCNPLELKNKSGLQVITNDAVVSIFIDDHFLGESPFLTKDLKPGEYTLKLEPKSSTLVAYETTLTLRKGLLSVITWKPGTDLTSSGGVIYELEKLPDRKQTELSVISIPDGAIVSIDGKEKEFAPFVKEDIEEGNHDFEVSLPSYETQKHTINVVKGHRLNVLVKLAKESNGMLAQNTAPTVETTTQPDEIARRTTLPDTATTAGSVQGATTPTTATASANAPQPVRRTGQTGQQVLIKPTGYFENDTEVLRVRAASTSAAAQIGTVNVGQQYPYLNEQTSAWIKIGFNNQAGWVSSQYAEIK